MNRVSGRLTFHVDAAVEVLEIRPDFVILRPVTTSGQAPPQRLYVGDVLSLQTVDFDLDMATVAPAKRSRENG